MTWIKRLCAPLVLAAAFGGVSSYVAPADAEANWLYTTHAEEALRGQRAEWDNDIKKFWDSYESSTGRNVVSSRASQFNRLNDHALNILVDYYCGTGWYCTSRWFRTEINHGSYYINDYGF